MTPSSELVARVHEQARAPDPTAWCELDLAEQRTRLAQLVRQEAPLLPDPELEPTVRSVLARVAGLGPLESFLEDASITEVMVNGGGAVWIERGGRIQPTSLVL